MASEEREQLAVQQEGDKLQKVWVWGGRGAFLASAATSTVGQSGKHDSGVEVPVSPLVSRGLTVFAGRTHWCSRHHTDNGC